MEIQVVDKGTLPQDTLISVRSGAVRKQMRLDTEKPIVVPVPNKEDEEKSDAANLQTLKVDILEDLGYHVLDYTPEQSTYDVTIKSDKASAEKEEAQLSLNMNFRGENYNPRTMSSLNTPEPGIYAPSSPVHRLSSAKGMKTYLDEHNLVNKMQGLLQEILQARPDDPTEYMMGRLATNLSPLPSGATSSQAPAAAADKPPAEAEAAQPSNTDDPADDASDAGSDEEEHPPERRSVSLCGFVGAKKKRGGVSAEQTKSAGDYKPPVFEKTPEERQKLAEMIQTSRDGKLHMLFGNVKQDAFEKILDAMQVQKVVAGENAIEYGAVGEFFYIVKAGKFDIFVVDKDKPGEQKKVFEAGAGFAFGEMALLYNAPRSATIRATTDSEVWALDRQSFRMLVVKSAEDQFKLYVDFVASCDIFHGLDPNEMASLAEVLEEENFEDDEAIVEQGEKDDKMFIIQKGAAVACVQGEKGEVEVMSYAAGSYFGEIALMKGEPRKASVYAVGQCSCLYITRETFNRVLGPIKDVLARNLDKYVKYQDAIKEAEAEGEPAENEEEIVPETDVTAKPEGRGSVFHSGQQSSKMKIHRAKRDKTKQVLESSTACAHAVKEKEDAAPPTTLKDKVEADFNNPLLVTANDSFKVKNANMQAFAGMKKGQKFTMDKPITTYSSNSCSMVKDENDEIHSWEGKVKVKEGLSAAVLCQKGQKSAFDPTPNQDNFFVISVPDEQGNTINLFGICDGHGPFGHLVSFRLVQSMPKFTTESEHFAKKNYEAAMREGFQKAEADLEEFATSQNILIDASGAAASMMIQEEQNLHIAFCGDARIFLGSWNKRDTRDVFITTDHKPELPLEKAFLESHGHEVREAVPGCGSYRIYDKPGSSYPGLSMSRAMGDIACVLNRDPEYHKYTMQPTDEWYAVVASDGIWEFMGGEDVSKLAAKKLRLKGPRETVKFLVDCARKRWNHFEGDYCDDITAILVQFNNHDKKTTGNHTLVLNTINNPAV